MATTEQVKKLRDETGVSIMQCKKALEEAKDDMEKAKIVLQKKGGDIAAKKSDRTLGSGSVACYIHANGSVGAMVELSCETDFVSGNEEFKTLARDLAMQVTASNPEFVKKEDITAEARAKVAEVFAAEVANKPEAMREKILQGKLDAYFADKILLEQDYIKNPDLKIRNLVETAVQKFGEKIEIARFARFSVLGK
ncbi:MAG: elongation factor Ts [Candidatus Paceibacterota bacterium]|jgi:elongation factor Ts